MPTWDTKEIDYARLQVCRRIVKAQMLQQGFEAAEAKFERVMNDRAWKMYRKP